MAFIQIRGGRRRQNSLGLPFDEERGNEDRTPRRTGESDEEATFFGKILAREMGKLSRERKKWTPTTVDAAGK